MKFSVDIKDILADPIVEHIMCSFASTTKGNGKLVILTNIVTKEVSYKILGNTGETITNDLAEAVTLYNLIGV